MAFTRSVLVDRPEKPFPPVLSSFRKLSNGSFSWSLSGGAGFTWIIQTSLDLVTWSDLQTVTAGSESVELTAPASNDPARFYRVIAR
jgi:hypothetical protein